MLREHCISDLGKLLCEPDELFFHTDFDLLQISLQLTNEFKQICESDDEFPTSFYFDVRPYLDQIRIEGTWLDVQELFDIRRSLDSIRAVVKFLKDKGDIYPNLFSLTENVKLYPFVIDKIDSVINKFGKIRDNASSELSNIRREMISKEMSISKILSHILKHAQSEGLVDADVSLTMRDGKMLIPINSAYKRKIKGVVHDESATGKTSYIEPIEIVEANNELKELEFAERREIIKILVLLSSDIRPYIDDLNDAYNFLAMIDFIRAKALFAIRIKACLPAKFYDQNAMRWFTAVHPLLFLTNQKENKSVVPLDIELNDKDRIILISGPNAGGKSVCLKTVGLLQYMFQCGMLPPVNEMSVMGMFKNIFIDIGDEQSIENDLSTYSSHLKSMKFFVENVNENTLILIDEFGTGTEPMLGGAIAEAMLDEMNIKKARGVITTHYTNLKHFATSAHGIVNGAMLYDTNKMQPLFELAIGQPGSSFAFEIAKKIGLPNVILQKATDKIGKDHIDFDKHLKDIEQDRRQLENLKKQMLQKEDELEKTIQNYNKEIDFSVKQRKNILKLTQEQAKDILGSINKQIENAIFEIKKSNADKDKTKEVRQQIDEFKTGVIDNLKIQEDRLEEKIERLKQKKVEAANKKAERIELPEEFDEEVVDKTISVGDTVKIIKQDAIGEVLEIKGESLVISFGYMQTMLHKDKIEKVSRNEAKRLEGKTERTLSNIGWKPEKQRSSFLFGLDVRGMRADEALQKVMHYIDEAIVADASEVKILHGTGNGILRKLIRDYLRSVDVVKDCKDESIDSGGAGITVVTLEY